MALGAVSPIACIEIRPVTDVDESLRLNFMLTSPRFTALKSSTVQRNGWLLGSILAMVTIWCGLTFVNGTAGGLQLNHDKFCSVEETLMYKCLHASLLSRPLSSSALSFQLFVTSIILLTITYMTSHPSLRLLFLLATLLFILHMFLIVLLLLLLITD